MDDESLKFVWTEKMIDETTIHDIVVIHIETMNVIASASVMEANKPIPYVSCVWVHPEWRRKGLGEKMMAAAKDWAQREPSIEAVRLWAKPEKNPGAVALYRKLGWRGCDNIDPTTGSQMMTLHTGA